MNENRSKSQEMRAWPSSRRDEWSLINEQKFLQQQKAKMYEQSIQAEKRQRLKDELQHQIWEKNQKQQLFKRENQKYAQQIQMKSKEAQYLEEVKRRDIAQRRKYIQYENKNMFYNIMDDNSKHRSDPRDISMDIGYQAQLERSRQRDNYKKDMIDELDRQIQQKDRQKLQHRREEMLKDKMNDSYQKEKEQQRYKRMHSKHYGQNPYVYQQYQHIVQKQKGRERQFQKNQIQEAGRRKLQQQIHKSQQKDWNKRYMNSKMRQMLDQQIKIKEQQRRQEERTDPEELTYGSIGKMLSQRQSQSNKKQYYEDLRRQIEEKQRKKEGDRYMTDQQYKINLNQLYRAVDGKYAQNTYVDRSIHSLSDSHKVNVAMIDTHVENPESELVRKKLQELRVKNRERINHSVI